MEHPRNERELAITREMDFIIPLKQVGMVTRAVIEAVISYYEPRRIFLIMPSSEEVILQKLLNIWQLPISHPVIFFDEESFFQSNGLKLSLKDILAEYDNQRGILSDEEKRKSGIPGAESVSGDLQREAGWWIQQLIKLGATFQIPDISKHYVVWDGDLIPLRRWKLVDVDPITNQINYSIAILQAQARSVFNANQYAACMLELTGMHSQQPQEEVIAAAADNNGNGEDEVARGTFVTHHMVFHTVYVKELFDLMYEMTQSTLPWPQLIMSYSRKYFRFSEYQTYCTFLLTYHPEALQHHPLSHFGASGWRYRDAHNVIDELKAFHSTPAHYHHNHHTHVQHHAKRIEPPITTTATTTAASAVSSWKKVLSFAWCRAIGEEEETEDDSERNSEAEETETETESESESDCSGESEITHSTNSKVISSFQGGFTYAHIQQYVATTIRTSNNNTNNNDNNTLIIMPAYIQLDHVYGNLC